ncbi:MAG: PASTA domain-containing protein [Polyangia bacterium]
MNRQEEVNAIKKAIVEAFADAAAPGEEDIAPHGCGECQRVRDDLKGHHWQALPDDILEYHHDSLPLLGPRAFCFFLPAYLLAALKESDPWGFDSIVIFNLTPPETLDREEISWFLERVQGFSSAQIASIFSFLHYLQEGDDEVCADRARYALERYWGAAAQGNPPGATELTPPPGEGETWVRMPSLIGKKAADVAAVLSTLGLKSVKTVVEPQYPHSSVEPGTILTTSPRPGELARFDRELTLYIGGPIQ